MSGSQISISELAAKRAAMTFGAGAMSDGGTLVDADGDEIGALEMSRDAEGLLAEHDAMPTLIAIAKAALAFHDVLSSDDVPSSAVYNGAFHALAESLSKIRP